MDQGWTEANLTAPLFEDNPQSLDLWSDLSGRRYGPEVLKIIGEGMINRSADLRLDVNVRKSFIFNLVLELLFANKNECEPVVSKPRVQQALREADAEVRAYAADTLRRFVSDLSEGRKNQPVVAAELFRVAIAPFLSHTWPKELSLLSESTSEAFAKLPGVSGNAFSDAVEHVERYLDPFSCYSLSAYKIFTDNNTSGRFSAIHDRESTLALLKLLDLTIGRSDGAVVPHDLSDALDQIRTVVPTAVNSQSFGRLSTIARRR